MSMRTGLNKSKNMISIRLLQAVGPKYGQEWVTRFGFDADKHPAYLTMALGAGSVTPMQMAAGYSVADRKSTRLNSSHNSPSRMPCLPTAACRCRQN